MSAHTHFHGEIEIHRSEHFSIYQSLRQLFNDECTIYVIKKGYTDGDSYILYHFEGSACLYVDEFCTTMNRWMRYRLPRYCKKPMITITYGEMLGMGFHIKDS